MVVRTRAELVAALPLDAVVTLGGKPVHTAWLGGTIDDPGALRLNRYGLALDPGQVDLADASWVAAPASATGVEWLASNLVAGGWSFFSATGADYVDFYSDAVPSAGDFLAPPVTDANPYRRYLPHWQHYWLCELTGTHRAGSPTTGGYALYAATEPANLATDVAAKVGGTSNDVVVLAIDGTGSFGSGTGATQYVDNFIAAYSAALPGNATRLVVTRFSDWPAYTDGPLGSPTLFGAEGDMPAVTIGTWAGISPSITAAVIDATLAADTGRGGDENESQFEGIALGMRNASAYTGHRAIVVYTDSASVVAWGGAPPTITDTWLRALQRSDGLDLGGPPRAVQRATRADSLRAGTAVI